MKSKHLFRIGLCMFLCNVIYIVLPWFIDVLEFMLTIPWIVHNIYGVIAIAIMIGSVAWDTVSFSKSSEKSSLRVDFWSKLLSKIGGVLLAVLWFGMWYVVPRLESNSPPPADILIKVAFVDIIIMIALFIAATVIKVIGASKKRKIAESV